MRPSCTPLLLILGTALFSSSGFAQNSPAFPTLLQGTPVTLQLNETVNSATARMGQRVAFEVTSDVMSQDRVAIPAGCSALGTVVQVLHRGWTNKLGHGTSRLDVKIDAVRLPSGQIVPLAVSPDVEDNGRGTTSDSIATSLEPSPVTPRLLSVHRKDVLIPEGTILRAYVRRDTAVVQQTASVSN
jgi:hypothetical protein